LGIKMLEKLSESRNDVIGRSELIVVADVDGGTPSRGETIKAVSELLKIDTNRLALVRIKPSFGSSKTLINVRVYDTPEALLIFEPRYRLIRQGLLEPKKEKGRAAS